MTPLSPTPRWLAAAAALVAALAACAGSDSAEAGSAPPTASAAPTSDAPTGGAGTDVGGDNGGQAASGGQPAGGGEVGAGAASSPPALGVPTPAPTDALGAFPVDPSPITRGGTMTFTNVGAPGAWPRRLDAPAGSSACSYKDGTDTWGGQCCQELHQTSSASLSPFDEEMTLIMKAINVRQLAVYQPAGSAPEASWARVTSWDARSEQAQNLWFTRSGDGSPSFPGDLSTSDCVGYVAQEATVACDGLDYKCPDDPGMLHRGYAGSKLITFLASMDFEDQQVGSCGGDGAGHPGPWVAFVASELIRDGARKWDGLCNCYSKTGSVGDGCGEINVFEVVVDGNEFSNREFISTGVRSYQAGHVGGAVCGADCRRDAFAADADVVDACAGVAYSSGPELVVGGATDGCPVWRRPEGERYFFILLDEATRQIQVAIVHPDNVPAAAAALLPAFPGTLGRASIDALLEMRLPG